MSRPLLKIGLRGPAGSVHTGGRQGEPEDQLTVCNVLKSKPQFSLSKPMLETVYQ